MTALQELILYIKEDPWDNKGKGDILVKAISLLEKEKKDIIEAWAAGKGSDYYETSSSYLDKKYKDAKVYN